MGQEREHQGRCWGLRPLNQNCPLLPHLTQEGNSGEGAPSSSTISVFGEEPWDGGAGDKPTEERRLLPSEGTGAGLPRWGAGLSWFLPLEERPSPILAPTCIRAAEKRLRTRLCSHSASSQPLGGESRGSWTRLSSSPKRTGGKGRKPRARGKDEEARADGARVSRDQDHDPRPGLKHFCSQTLERQGKPSFPRPPPPLGAPSGRTGRWREVRCASSYINMGTLKIHAMSPVHYV